ARMGRRRSRPGLVLHQLAGGAHRWRTALCLVRGRANGAHRGQVLRRAGSAVCYSTRARPARRASGDDRRASEVELVTQTADGHQVLGVRRIRFDLAPKPFDVDVERLRVADVVGPPDPVDELAAREYATGVAQQQL